MEKTNGLWGPKTSFLAPYSPVYRDIYNFGYDVSISENFALIGTNMEEETDQVQINANLVDVFPLSYTDDLLVPEDPDQFVIFIQP